MFTKRKNSSKKKILFLFLYCIFEGETEIIYMEKKKKQNKNKTHFPPPTFQLRTRGQLLNCRLPPRNPENFTRPTLEYRPEESIAPSWRHRRLKKIRLSFSLSLTLVLFYHVDVRILFIYFFFFPEPHLEGNIPLRRLDHCHRWTQKYVN